MQNNTCHQELEHVTQAPYQNQQNSHLKVLF
jgi:hypothetical protein